MHGPSSEQTEKRLVFFSRTNSVKFVLEDCYNSDVASYVFENKMSVTRATAFWETLLRIDLRSYYLFLIKLIVVVFV